MSKYEEFVINEDRDLSVDHNGVLEDNTKINGKVENLTLDSCQIELNSQCNALCKFCPREEILKEEPYLNIQENRNINLQMTLEHFKSIIDQSKPLGLSRVHFTGFGEQTRWKWFKEAFDYCGLALSLIHI